MRLRFGVGVAMLAATFTAAGCTQQAESLLSLPDDQRNIRFVEAIRSAGYRCEEIVDVTVAEGGRMVWRVVCNDAHVYLASIDATDAIHMEPVPYADPAGVVPGSRLEQQGPPRQR
jgi:precorrin-4 methylase